MVFEGVCEQEKQTNQDLTPEYPHHFTVVFQGLYGQEQFSHQVISNSSASFVFSGCAGMGVAGCWWGAGRQGVGQVDKVGGRYTRWGADTQGGGQVDKVGAGRRSDVCA